MVTGEGLEPLSPPHSLREWEYSAVAFYIKLTRVMVAVMGIAPIEAGL